MGGDIVELGLSRERQQLARCVYVAAETFDRLLDRLLELAPHVVAPEAAALRADLEPARLGLRGVTDPYEWERLGSAAVDACEAFLRRSRGHLAEREGELVELIAVLREAVAVLSGGSARFHDRLDASAASLAELAKIDDIKQLKQRMLQEVEQLKAVALERQRQEQAHFSKLQEHVQVLESRLVRAEDEAARDALTGIPNRGAFDRILAQRIATARGSDRRFVLAMVDIDDFKPINDAHGHVVGDRVIVCVAQHLAGSLRATDSVARFGGDEFALVMDGIALDPAKKRLSAIQRTLPGAYRYEQDGAAREVGFSYSVGLAEFAREDTAETLLARADAALYEAKRRGKGRIEAPPRSRSGLRRMLG